MNPPPIKRNKTVLAAEHLFEDIDRDMALVFEDDRALHDAHHEVVSRTEQADAQAATAEAHRKRCSEIEMEIAEIAAALKAKETELKNERALMSGALYRERMKRKQASDSAKRIEKRQAQLVQREINRRAKQLGRQFYTARGRPKKGEEL